MIEFEQALCPRCGAAGDRPVYSGRDYLHGIPGEFTVAECTTCGLWFQNPRPVAADLEQLYPSDYRPHLAAAGHVDALPPLPAWRARFYHEQLGYPSFGTAASQSDWRSLPALGWLRRWMVGVSLVPRYVADGRVLEIGCGSGSRLLALRQAGWQDLHGIDLVPAAVEVARAAGLSAECGPVEEVLERYPDASLDVVISSMVLEHLRDPFAVVAAVARKLKPGGQFLFSTIRRDSVDAALYGAYWAGFDFPRHLVHFHRSDLDTMLAGAFANVEYFFQSAPVDFVRASSWRSQQGDGRAIDRMVLRLAGTAAAAAISMALALAGRTCRVSCRCIRALPSGTGAQGRRV